MDDHRPANRLIHETSPYLQQHAHNPVDWYPWCDEALQLAKRDDLPILLSIGYSACHWCHVMAHESFENEEIAALMNRHFVCIKVDREERPDLDAIYMTAVQMLTGSGGWPLTVFLTPDQVPFYGGTYFPPEDRHGVPGFRRVLLGVAQAYRERREGFLANVHSLASDLQNSNALPGTPGRPDGSLLEAAASAMTRNYDPRNGGFGSAPKFPPSMALTFLLRMFLRTGDGKYLEIVENTLTRMARGGMYDQLGGGFHRYSVDAEWRVPHFEKMLYDNALLSRIYLDAWLRTQNGFYRGVAEEVLDYVAREMTSPEGGFYSSQDADSEGVEGKFFLWSAGEVKSLLGEEEGELFCRYFGCSPQGNFDGRNILHVPLPAGAAARSIGVDEDCLRDVVGRGRRTLLEARERRVKPGLDDKILTAWNGLMLRSYAEAANALDREDYRAAAVRNAGFLLSRLRVDGRLLRSCRNGQARFNAYLEDYACLVDGLISVYEATFDAHWIREAEGLARLMIDKFGDPRGGGFYFTSEDHETLIHRPREFYDNATPSGNSVAAMALLRLWKLTGEECYMRPVAALLENASGLVAQHPAAFAHLLCAMDFFLGPASEIAIAGDPRDAAARRMLDTVFHGYLPNRVVACGTGDDPPLLRQRPQIGGAATAYVCENFACRLPVTTAEELAAVLQGRVPPQI